MRPKLGPGRRPVRDHLSEPNRGFDRLDLAEEGLQVIKLMMTPVLEQRRGFRRHLPLVGVRQATPCRNVAANFIDDRRRVVFLLGRREAISGAEPQFTLARCPAAFLWFRDWRDQFGAATVVDDPVRRLAFPVQLPVPAGMEIRRIENRPLEKAFDHDGTPSSGVRRYLIAPTYDATERLLCQSRFRAALAVRPILKRSKSLRRNHCG